MPRLKNSPTLCPPIDADLQRIIEPHVSQEVRFVDDPLFGQPGPIHMSDLCGRVDCKVTDAQGREVLEKVGHQRNAFMSPAWKQAKPTARPATMCMVPILPGLSKWLILCLNMGLFEKNVKK